MRAHHFGDRGPAQARFHHLIERPQLLRPAAAIVHVEGDAGEQRLPPFGRRHLQLDDSLPVFFHRMPGDRGEQVLAAVEIVRRQGTAVTGFLTGFGERQLIDAAPRHDLERGLQDARLRLPPPLGMGTAGFDWLAPNSNGHVSSSVRKNYSAACCTTRSARCDGGSTIRFGPENCSVPSSTSPRSSVLRSQK